MLPASRVRQRTREPEIADERAATPMISLLTLRILFIAALFFVFVFFDLIVVFATYKHI